MLPDIFDEVKNCRGQEVASLLGDLCRDAIRARDLIVFQCPFCKFNLLKCWQDDEIQDGRMDE